MLLSSSPAATAPEIKFYGFSVSSRLLLMVWWRNIYMKIEIGVVDGRRMCEVAARGASEGIKQWKMKISGLESALNPSHFEFGCLVTLVTCMLRSFCVRCALTREQILRLRNVFSFFLRQQKTDNKNWLCMLRARDHKKGQQQEENGHDTNQRVQQSCCLPAWENPQIPTKLNKIPSNLQIPFI